MNNFLILVVFVASMACRSKHVADVQEQPAAEMNLVQSPKKDFTKNEEAEPIPATSPHQTTIDFSPKLVRNAQIRIRVDDVKTAGQTVERAVRQQGGQITSSNEMKTDVSLESELVIRVPAARFDTLMAAILNKSIYTDSKTITVDDVTRQYVDTEARIRSKKAVEETYLRLLKQARNVGEVLKVEEQLAAIREEREVQEAELRHLKNEVDLSTINLTYYQLTERTLQPKEPIFVQIWHNLADGVRTMEILVVGLFYLLPSLMVGGLLVWFLLRLYRRYKGVI